MNFLSLAQKIKTKQKPNDYYQRFKRLATQGIVKYTAKPLPF